ncbi:MAG: 3-phosphoserine/phosphohydroxythreonine transaminase [Gammaproteobacteria bacterium]|nr:3-phosphoserine/phosphohydroxythreonine transaminase [Gammaproteobacteria bacterium]MYD75130.1 3-phosphoserine/phosphohydroxythreonine transaminase [Gammaproteobacteria bacterium]MYJ51543.1 3-phosphoserine/phosphohydroxythreonine transaminase [Gammaproteobacteria bacterium]
MNKRAHNFSAGPCTLPLECLEEAQKEFVNYHDTGMSLIEMSHRGKHFVEVANDAMRLCMEVFEVPDEFSVLFLQGGAIMQFSMVPMNLLVPGKKAGYVHSGTWAKGAITDAKAYGDVYIAWNGEQCGYTRMPDSGEIEIQDDTRYLHITTNETIEGIRYPNWPDVGVPLVGDMSSEYMARPVPWEKFDLIYGGAQKNLGPSGLCVVFVRKSILEHTNSHMGRYLRYDVHESKTSMFNTPPVFSIYMLGKVLKWMKKEGGLKVMESRAAEKAGLLYDTIDQSGGYYSCPVDVACRSHMNVVFRLPSEELEQQFLAEAGQNDLMHLKGHRSVGGCRASIYNALPRASVEALCSFMSDFLSRNG